MEVKLVVVGGRHAGKEIPVTGPQFLIGRGERCQLRPQSDMVSREHCAIVVEEGTVVVRDLNSRNGTFVNQQRVEGSRKLHSGDRLKIGPLEFEVRLATRLNGFEVSLPPTVKLTTQGVDWFRYQTSSPLQDNPLVLRSLLDKQLPVIGLYEIAGSLEQVYMHAINNAAEQESGSR